MPKPVAHGQSLFDTESLGSRESQLASYIDHRQNLRDNRDSPYNRNKYRGIICLTDLAPIYSRRRNLNAILQVLPV